MNVFIEGQPIDQVQQQQLKPLIDRRVYLEELILENTPEGTHYIFAHHLGKSQHFYINDKANERQSIFVCESIWNSIK